MARAYSSFLVRYWQLDGGRTRIEVQHIQTGQRTRVASAQAAIAWIGALSTDPSTWAASHAQGETAPPSTIVAADALTILGGASDSEY